MPKLQKHFAYKYKEQEHYKHVIVIPGETIKKLGWEAGVDLTQKINGNNLILSLNNPQITNKVTTKRNVQSHKKEKVNDKL